jgi:predicted  nucleic acid-binding Zn-ribbon protein
MNDLTSAVFSEDKRKLSAARCDQQSSKEEFARVHELLSLRVAKKDQTIQTLHADKAALDNKNKTLMRAVELLHKELEKTSASLSETQQKAVELRMQGWDYKGEVDRRCQKIVTSVQTRMGFVPSGIHKQISQLKILKVGVSLLISCSSI